MNKRPGERQEPWLLIKSDDEYARGQIRSGYSRRDARTRWRPAARWIRSPTAADGSGTPTAGQRAIAKTRRGEDEAGAKRLRARSGPKATTAGDKTRQENEEAAGSLRQVGRSPARRRQRCRLSCRPASPRSATSAPDARDWIHEIKFDGYRMQARLRRRQGRRC